MQAPQPQAPQPLGTDATIVWRTFVTILLLVALVLAVIAVRDDGSASADSRRGFDRRRGRLG